jgi:hypothetical protein
VWLEQRHQPPKGDTEITAIATPSASRNVAAVCLS